MLHDIGKVKLPPEILEMRPSEMSEAQLEEYKKHPEIGAELLLQYPFITPLVCQMVAQHHEVQDGSGFPKGLKTIKITTMAKIISVADEFVHHIMETKEDPVMGLKSLLAKDGATQRYNAIVLEKFLHCFIDPKKLPKKANQGGGS